MSNLIDVAVVYNGVTKTIQVNLNQAVQAVLQHALNEFGVQQNRDNFGLFNANGQELNTSSSAQDAGITATSQLLLRPRQVRGGVWASGTGSRWRTWNKPSRCCVSAGMEGANVRSFG